MSRILAGAMIGNILGAALAGAIGDIMGWRGVLLLLGILTLVTASAAGLGLRGRATNKADHPASLASLAHGYRVLFANPRTKICYLVVFFEGCCVLGVLPFVAAFLFELGETRLSIAGTVIAGFAVGGGCLRCTGRQPGRGHGHSGEPQHAAPAHCLRFHTFCSS